MTDTNFEKAEKINEKDYQGHVYWDLVDKYFSSVEALLDHVRWRNKTRKDEYIWFPPHFVWATKAVQVEQVSVESILSDSYSELYDDAWEDLQSQHSAELQKLESALESFYKATADIKGMEADYTKAIILDPGHSPFYS